MTLSSLLKRFLFAWGKTTACLCCEFVVGNGTIDFGEFCVVMRRHQQTAAAADAQQAFKACTHTHTHARTLDAVGSQRERDATQFVWVCHSAVKLEPTSH